MKSEGVQGKKAVVLLEDQLIQAYIHLPMIIAMQIPQLSAGASWQSKSLEEVHYRFHQISQRRIFAGIQANILDAVFPGMGSYWGTWLQGKEGDKTIVEYQVTQNVEGILGEVQLGISIRRIWKEELLEPFRSRHGVELANSVSAECLMLCLFWSAHVIDDRVRRGWSRSKSSGNQNCIANHGLAILI